MMSLQSEVKRVHGAVICRVAVFVMPTVKAAYEAETKIVSAIGLVKTPIGGRREFFEGIAFHRAVAIVESTAGPKSWSATKQPA